MSSALSQLKADLEDKLTRRRICTGSRESTENGPGVTRRKVERNDRAGQHAPSLHDERNASLQLTRGYVLSVRREVALFPGVRFSVQIMK